MGSGRTSPAGRNEVRRGETGRETISSKLPGRTVIGSYTAEANARVGRSPRRGHFDWTMKTLALDQPPPTPPETNPIVIILTKDGASDCTRHCATPPSWR